MEESLKVVGGIPHGFGVWIEGKFHRVDLGALGTLISELQQWKETAIKNSLDAQKIGNALGLQVGTQVTTQLVVDSIINLQFEVSYLTRGQ